MRHETPAERFKTTCLRLFIVSILATSVVGAVTLLIEPSGWWRLVQERILATCAILTGASFWGLVSGWLYNRGYRVLPTISMLFVLSLTFSGILEVWNLIGEALFGKLVGTSAILSVASLGGFINRECYKAGRNAIPALGGVLTGIAALTGVLLVWEILEFNVYPKVHLAPRLLGATTTMAIGFTHLSMLLLMKLQRSYRWVHGAAYYIVLGLASLISALIITAGAGFDEAFTVRIVGVWSIAATAVTLIIPVLWFLSRGALDNAGDTASELQRRITKKRTELAALEAQLAALPPAINSPWDVQDAANGSTASRAGGAC